MKGLVLIGLIAGALGGCAVVPIGPPVAYVGPRAVVVAPVFVRPYYYGRWSRY